MENGGGDRNNSNFQRHVTLTLMGPYGIPSCISIWPLPTYYSNGRNGLWMDGQTYIWTYVQTMDGRTDIEVDLKIKLLNLLSHCKSTMGPKNWCKIGKESIGSPPKYNRSVPRPRPTPTKNFIKNPFITFADIWFTRNDYTHSHTQSTDTTQCTDTHNIST